MKKSLLAIATILTCSISFSQIEKTEPTKFIEIGKAKAGFTKLADLSYTVNNNDTTYLFSYNDKKFIKIDKWETVSFGGGSEVLQQFYTFLTQAIEADKGQQTQFKLGVKNFSITTSKLLGSKYLSITIEKAPGVYGLAELSKSQINSLFGK